MKKLIIALVLLLVVIAVAVWYQPITNLPSRTVKLTITGSKGERFSGRYTANNKSSDLAGIVPTTVTVNANEFSYAFKPSSTGKDFRVVLDVDGAHRTSFVSYKGGTVKGGWYYKGEVVKLVCWNYSRWEESSY